MKKVFIFLFAAALTVSSAIPAIAESKIPKDYPAKELFEGPSSGSGESSRSFMDSFKPFVDMEKFINNGQVDALVNSYKLYIENKDGMDPAVIKYWDDRGIKKVKHTENPRTTWYAYVPEEALAKDNKEKFPLIFNLPHEDPFQCEARGYVELAAKERLIVVIPTVIENEDLMMQYVEVMKMYPMVDTSRVYMTGFSFTGFRTEAFALRHPEVLAGIAVNCHLWPFMWEMPEKWVVDHSASLKMPIVHHVGNVDLADPLPIHSEITEPNPRYGNDHIHSPQDGVDRANMWFKINDARRISLQESLSMASSENKVEREIGAPVSRSKILKIDGTEYYIGDFISSDGVYRTRLISMDNIPHWPFGSMAEVTWEFLKHFSRDTKTGESLIDGELPL